MLQRAWDPISNAQYLEGTVTMVLVIRSSDVYYIYTITNETEVLKYMSGTVKEFLPLCSWFFNRRD